MDHRVHLKNFGITLEHPIMNGAGTVKKIDEVSDMARSATAAIMVGSITVEPRPGNSGNVYYVQDTAGVFSLNSLGIPNGGLPYYEQHLSEMVAISNEAGKPLFLSVAGFDVEEFCRLAEFSFRCGVDVTELNVGCPNIVHGDVAKPVISYDFDFLQEILIKVSGCIERVLVKVSPFSNPADRKKLCELLVAHPVVGGVVATNTLPNGFAYDGMGDPVITPNDGYAGIAGPALKPLALAHVRQFSKLMPGLDIIGAGGVAHWTDVHDYEKAGAAAVQIATGLLGDVGHLDPGVISDILAGYIENEEKATRI